MRRSEHDTFNLSGKRNMKGKLVNLEGLNE